jgi:hypothetical protein
LQSEVFEKKRTSRTKVKNPTLEEIGSKNSKIESKIVGKTE